MLSVSLSAPLALPRYLPFVPLVVQHCDPYTCLTILPRRDQQYQTFAASREGHFQLRTGPAVMPRTFSEFNKPPPATAPAGASRPHTYLRRRTAPNTAQGTRPGIKLQKVQKQPLQKHAAGLQEDAPVADEILEQEGSAEGAEADAPDSKPTTLPPIAPPQGGSSSGTLPLLSPRASGSMGAAAAGALVSNSGNACMPTPAQSGTSSGSRGSGSRTPSDTSRLSTESGAAGLTSPRTSGPPPYVTPGSIHVPSKAPVVLVPDPLALRSRPSSSTSTGTAPVQAASEAGVPLHPLTLASPRPGDGTPQRSSGAGSVGRTNLTALDPPAAAAAVPSPRNSRGSLQRPLAASPRPTSARPGSGASGRASAACQDQAATVSPESSSAAAGQEGAHSAEGNGERPCATAATPVTAEEPT